MAITPQDKKELIAELMASGQRIDTLPIVDSLEGLESLPAVKDGTLVKAPIAKLKGERGEKGDTGERGETGPQGERGEPFKYTDFTQAQLAALTGPQGPQGPQGEPFKYTDFTTEQLQQLKGQRGDTGEQGPVGPKGDTGERGMQGIQGFKGDTGAQGPKGDRGPQGERGEKGDTGERGEKLTFADLTETDKAELMRPALDAAEVAHAAAEALPVIKWLTQAEYDALAADGNIEPNTEYNIYEDD